MIRSAAPAVRLKEGSASPALGVALFLLMKPGVVAAVVLAGFAGMVLASGGAPPHLTGWSCVTALSLASAGSAMINNVLDRRMDRLMERVQYRCAALDAAGAGVVFGVALCLIGTSLVLAASFLTTASVLLLSAAVFSYTVCYTLYLKRHSHWGAILGGIPGALPVLIGQAALPAAPTAAPFLLFLIMLLWQPPHFWILSLLHREEYRRAGVPVLPVVKGEAYTLRCIGIGCVTVAAAPPLLTLYGPCSPIFALVSLFLGAFFCCANLVLLKARRYRVAFSGSILYLLALLSCVVIDLCLRLP